MRRPPAEDALLVDARGHRCPTPTLRLRRALESAGSGACVTVLADDPLARIDIPHFVQSGGHSLVAADASDRALRFVVRKA